MSHGDLFPLTCHCYHSLLPTYAKFSNVGQFNSGIVSFLLNTYPKTYFYLVSISDWYQRTVIVYFLLATICQQKHSIHCNLSGSLSVVELVTMVRVHQLVFVFN